MYLKIFLNIYLASIVIKYNIFIKNTILKKRFMSDI
jgi:hypothetical protein